MDSALFVDFLRGKTVKRTGRPQKPIDLRQLQVLCEIQCTDEEIAAVLDISVDTLTRRKKNKEFMEVMKAGRAQGKESLRRKQWETAMGGNTALLIFLGKQYLGQSDKMEQSVTELPPLIITGPSAAATTDV